MKHRQTPWATVQITGKIYVYANFIPNDQKDKDEGTTGLPSLGVMVRKDKPPEILTLKSRVTCAEESQRALGKRASVL